jgi:hypothetical protein
MATFSRSAVLDWAGGFPRGDGSVSAGSAAFDVAASFPMVSGEWQSGPQRPRRPPPSPPRNRPPPPSEYDTLICALRVDSRLRPSWM